MKRISLFLALLIASFSMFAQSWNYVNKYGKCGEAVSYEFDGNTLFIRNADKKGKLANMNDYDLDRKKTPWKKFKNEIRKVVIGDGVVNIGACAFAECSNIQDVRFESSTLVKIGWAAFYKCSKIRSISLPVQLAEIEDLAFGDCSSLSAIKIPGGCSVGQMAFANCTDLKSVDIASNVSLKDLVFVTEVFDGEKVGYKMYNGDVINVPPYVNASNCNVYGIAKDALPKKKEDANAADYDVATSEVDENIPIARLQHEELYALIIGNEDYRYAPNVPFAIHDARIFKQYCENAIGIPSQHIHIAENASKQMILEQEIEDWLSTIRNREEKKLIVYYCGHGVPDIVDQNKAYLLPVDVRGSNPKRGIALDDFYGKISDLAFNQTTIFLDACFSGVRGTNNGGTKAVFEGGHGVEIPSKPGVIPNGNLIVFSAAKSNEIAQGHTKEGHGLFTYYLLKAMRDTEGNVSFGALADYLKECVVRKSLQFDTHKQQTPEVNTSSNIADYWRNWTFWYAPKN